VWWHLGCIGEGRVVEDFWGDLSERSHLEELGTDKLNLFKLILFCCETSVFITKLRDTM